MTIAPCDILKSNLRRITCPILNIMARADDLVPCAQSLPFNDLVGSTDGKSIMLPAGHIGLLWRTSAGKVITCTDRKPSIQSEPPT